MDTTGNFTDEVVHYVVTKKENSTPNMNMLIKAITKYIQNNEIYFKYEPTFYGGVLLFGIVGLKSDHDKLKNILGGDIITLGCTLSTSITGGADESKGN